MIARAPSAVVRRVEQIRGQPDVVGGVLDDAALERVPQEAAEQAEEGAGGDA